MRGVWGAGLMRMGQPAAMAGCYLVGDQVEGEVEGGDGQDGADGEALDETPAAFVALGEV